MGLVFKDPRNKAWGHPQQVPETLTGICLAGLTGTWCTLHRTGLKGQTAVPCQWGPHSPGASPLLRMA